MHDRPLLLLRDASIAAVVSVLSVMVLVPVDGTLPGVDLDLSWRYTLADATARHIPFGRDMVFTLGPLSSIYTRFFLPDQRLVFTVLKVVLVLAFAFGTVAVSRRALRWVALALPLLLANLRMDDPFFLMAPWIIVPLATASWRHHRWQVPSLVALSVVLGPLVLVKGTIAIPLAISIGAAALALSRRTRLGALALPCAAMASAVVAWVAMGQQLLDLPYYFSRGTSVAAGYTDAMSLSGNPREIRVFLAGAAVLLLSQIVPRRAPVMPAIAGAVILFVAFKAGFVRHDGHASIAGGTLALLGFLLFLCRGTPAAGVGLLASLAAWLMIGVHYWPIDSASSWSQLTMALRKATVELKAEAGDVDAFRRRFEHAKARIADMANLAPTTGTVDLYPNSQVLLLASNRNYDPRPVMQSYSAYTPELASLNANHLEGSHAPNTVFFRIEPVDGRYPAMEDGPSWPALLAQYRFRSFSQLYAVLDRVEGAAAGTVDPPVASGIRAFGETIAVPGDIPFVWVKMQFHPTRLGRLISMVFKRPLLQMDVITADGQTKTFRLVAGMTSAGFLLSPTVTSAHDFVALRSTDRDALAGQRVTSVVVRQEGGGELWGRNFDLQFAALRIPADPAVDAMILGHLEDGPPAGELPVAGECVIDMVGGTPAIRAPITVTGKTVMVTGWGFVSPASEGRDGGNLRLALTPDNGTTAYASAERHARSDVDAHFHLVRPTRAGFVARVNLSSIDGRATLRVVQDSPSGPAVCSQVAIARPVASPQ